MGRSGLHRRRPDGPHRRPRLPRADRLEELPGALGRRGEDLGRRARHPGRDRRSGSRGPDRDTAAPPAAALDAGHGRRGIPRRAVHRAPGQLVQPGTLRPTDRPAVGSRDRSGAPTARVRGRRDVPPRVRLRDGVEPARAGVRLADRPARAPAAGPPAGALPVPVLRRAPVDRSPAGGPCQPAPGRPGEHLGHGRRPGAERPLPPGGDAAPAQVRGVPGGRATRGDGRRSRPRCGRGRRTPRGH